MKKKITAIIASLLLVFGLAGCSGGKGDDAVSAIKEKGKLVVGTSPDFPPYEWIVNVDGEDQIVGFEMDIAKDIADELGVELEISAMDFDGILPALDAGKIDLAMAGFTPTEERKKSVDFSVKFRDTEGGNTILATKENADKFKTLDDFKDLTIAVQKGTMQEAWLMDKHPEIKVQAIPKQTDGILAVTSGRADGLLLSDTVASIFLEKNDSVAATEVEIEDLANDSAAVAIKKGQEELVELVDKVINELKKEGKIEEYVKDNTAIMLEEE